MNTKSYAVINSNGAVNYILTTTEFYFDLDDVDIDPSEIENYYYDFETESFVAKEEIFVEYEIDDLIVTFTKIPQNLKVLIDGVYEEISEGDGWSIQFDDERVHTFFFFDNVKYLEKTIEIEIVL